MRHRHQNQVKKLKLKTQRSSERFEKVWCPLLGSKWSLLSRYWAAACAVLLSAYSNAVFFSVGYGFMAMRFAYTQNTTQRFSLIITEHRRLG